eukprot:TRINITY_DN5481_c0_g1_i2.p1 TRINITY_DN5481_c0_g1~~TRINITY_DN5481_c0_g1_i2.p1  ORF type:complete len:245 (+),score=60.02 TRINITY_DN5481_c0_g1_i2:106-840(+)
MEVAAGIGGLLIAFGGVGAYFSRLDSHKAQCLKETPILDLENVESAKAWQAGLTSDPNGPGRFVVILGSASSGAHQPLRAEGISKDLIYFRRSVKGRSLQVPWSPMTPFMLTQQSHRERKIAVDLNQRSLVWGVQKKSGVQEKVDDGFVEISSQIIPEDDDLLLYTEKETPAGSPFISALVSTLRFHYDYSTVVQERGLETGSRLLVAGEAKISKETGKPVVLPSKVALWSNPSFATTRPVEDL